MKRILKNKRGIAMESAVLFMLVMFMFGFLLTGVALTAHLRVKVNNTIIKREMEIEQIGEDLLNLDLTQDSASAYLAEKYNNYSAVIGDNNENGNKTLTLKRNNKVVLYVEYAGNNKEIKVWKYSIEEN